MDPVNPYAAPQTNRLHLADVEASTTLSPTQILFSLEGRIGRAQYWKYLLLAMLASFVAIFGFALLSRAIGGGAEVVWMLLAFVVVAPLGWISLALQVKRFHDRNRSGWWLLIGCVPFGNIWVAIETGFLAGTPGRNDFGLPSH